MNNLLDEQIQLYYGDCLEVLQKLIDNGVKVDAIICDPPYGQTFHNWDSIIPFKKLWPLLAKIRKNKYTPIVLFASNKFVFTLFNSNPDWYRYKWIWNKGIGTGFLDTAYKPLTVIEEILVFLEKAYEPVESEEIWKKFDRVAQFFPVYNYGHPNHSTGSRVKKANSQIYGSFKSKPELKAEYQKIINENLKQTTYNGFVDPVDIAKNINKLVKVSSTHDTTFYREGLKRIEDTSKTEKHPTNILDFKKEKANKYTKHHPTQKPLELLKYLVKTYSKENEVILDFTAGSGVLGVACKQLNRKAILIENEEKYINMIKKNLK